MNYIRYEYKKNVYVYSMCLIRCSLYFYIFKVIINILDKKSLINSKISWLSIIFVYSQFEMNTIIMVDQIK